MKAILSFALAALAVPASAQAPAPHKLILTWSAGGITVVDYPSASRCASAQRAVEAEGQRRTEAARVTAEKSGGMIVGSPWIVYAFCVPG